MADGISTMSTLTLPAAKMFSFFNKVSVLLFIQQCLQPLFSFLCFLSGTSEIIRVFNWSKSWKITNGPILAIPIFQVEVILESGFQTFWLNGPIEDMTQYRGPESKDYNIEEEILDKYA